MSPAIEPSLAWGGYGISPGRATVSRLQTARSGLLITPPPLVSSGPTRTGASRPRLRGATGSTQPGAVQPLHQPEEHPLPRVPRQQAVDEPTGGPDDLARHLDQRHAERRELHPQQRPLLRTVPLRPPGVLR